MEKGEGEQKETERSRENRQTLSAQGSRHRVQPSLHRHRQRAGIDPGNVMQPSNHAHCLTGHSTPSATPSAAVPRPASPSFSGCGSASKQWYVGGEHVRDGDARCQEERRTRERAGGGFGELHKEEAGPAHGRRRISFPASVVFFSFACTTSLPRMHIAAPARAGWQLTFLDKASFGSSGAAASRVVSFMAAATPATCSSSSPSSPSSPASFFARRFALRRYRKVGLVSDGGKNKGSSVMCRERDDRECEWRAP